jgi:hypothetical protein
MLKNIFTLIILFILSNCSSLDNHQRECEEEISKSLKLQLDTEMLYKLKVQEKRDRGE